MKQTIFSGIKPTGALHLGNYLGAISQWIKLQTDYQSIFCVVDYHAITVEHDLKNYHQQTIDIAKIYLAAGLDPQKTIIFRQSDLPEHTELAWILNCVSARMSDLNKMTQYKDKANNKNVSVGLFDYPVLMTADILLYDTDFVPVGEDQEQHVELARDLAKRFNHDFKPIFKIPKTIVRSEYSRIMGLDNALKKMSKTAPSPNNYIALTDSLEIARKKIMKAQTDSDTKIKYDVKNKPAISNLLTIYSALSGQDIPNLEKMYINKKYGEFKTDLANIVVSFLENFQAKINKISNSEIEQLFTNNAQKLKPIVEKKIIAVKKAIGIF